MTAKFGMYKGHPTISLYQDPNAADPRFAFTFGVGKALLILQHLDQIILFAKQHSAGEVADEAATTAAEIQAKELLKQFEAPK